MQFLLLPIPAIIIGVTLVNLTVFIVNVLGVFLVNFSIIVAVVSAFTARA